MTFLANPSLISFAISNAEDPLGYSFIDPSFKLILITYVRILVKIRNHFLNSSDIILNNEVKIIDIAITQKEIPQITRKIESFIPPKCIKTGPTNIGMNDNNKSLIFLEKFLLII